MENQIIGKLVELMREADQDTFDEMVTAAKRRMSEEGSEIRRKDFGSLFDSQIATLKDRGCPEQIVDMLVDQRDTVLSKKACEMIIEEGHVPFLPVIPTTHLTVYSQVSMVRNDCKEGLIGLDLNKISNVVYTPQRPYYIFDVEDGEAMRGKAWYDAERAIENQGRYGLTNVEVIALSVHTDVLSRHNVDAVGSRYDSGTGSVPSMWLNVGRPMLSHSRAVYAVSVWSAASCGSR